MIKYENFQDSTSKDEYSDFSLPNKIEKINFLYDCGRLAIYINDKEIYFNYAAGNDFTLLIKKEN